MITTLKPTTTLLRLFAILACCLLVSNALAKPNVKIKVTGVKGTVQENVVARLTTTLPKKATSTAIDNWYRRAKENVKLALQPYGYFRAKVSSTLGWVQGERTARFAIQVGPRMRVQTAQVSIIGPGRNNPIIQQVKHHSPIKSGMPLDTNVYEKAQQELLEAAHHQGYLDASLTQHRLQIDLQRYQANIQITVTTGQRYYFGQVRYSQTPFATSFLNRYLPFKSGDPYDSEKLLDFQDALSDSNYFSEVRLQPLSKHAHHRHIPIRVQLKPKRSVQYKFGIGYGTDTGVRGTIGWNKRFLGHYGHNFKVLLQASPVQSNFTAAYVIPGEDPLTDRYTLNTSVQTLDIDPGNSTTVQVGASYVSAHGSWQRTIGISLQNESYRFKDQMREHSVFLIPAVTWLKSTRKKGNIRASSTRLNISIQAAARELFSDATFLKPQISSRYFYQVNRNNRFVFRGEVGIMRGQLLSMVPLSLRYYAGGAQSVRGYQYQSIGPGRNLLIGSVEYQRRLFGDWYGVVFYDAGNAGDTFPGHLKRGTGVGINWSSSFGEIQLVFARALSEEGRPYRIQFSMGPPL